MGLEYLLTYGWAMVVIVTVVASLVFISFSPESEKVNFSAGGRHIIVKNNNISQCAGADSGLVLLENTSGETITITGISGTGSFSEIGGSSIIANDSNPPVVVAAGKQIRLEKLDAACGAIDGSITVNFTDRDNVPRSVEINGVGHIACCSGTQCSNGGQRNCPLQSGVCSSAKETCSSGAWPGCTTASYGALFEATEASCADLEDNDCDNKFDCEDSDCQARSECETYCTTHDARFPVKGGIEFVMHLSPVEGDCLDWQVGGRAFFLKNLSGETVTINNARVSLGPSHFDEYTASSCGFGGYFSSPYCEDSLDGNYPGGYNESFSAHSINGVLGSGENCDLNASSLPGEEIEIGISNFSFCANRDIIWPPECEYPNEEILRAHKDNPITIALNTSVGTITLYCYNFPPTNCTDGQQRDCPTQFGVCAGAKETCTDGKWPGCTAASYGSLYESAEASCADFQDNDCDGKTDCDDDDCKSSDDCKIYATTYDFRFPVKGGIKTAYMEINGCIEIIGSVTVAGMPPLQPMNPPALYLSPHADDNCTNWGIVDNTIFLKNLSGGTITVNNASVSLGPSHFDDYDMNACGFFGHFSSERCPDSNSGVKGGFTESFALASINGVSGLTQNCNINTSIPPDQEIRVGVSDFSYCANVLPPECECSTDVMLREHKDNPITIALNTSIGTINVYLYNFPTDSPVT